MKLYVSFSLVPLFQMMLLYFLGDSEWDMVFFASRLQDNIEQRGVTTTGQYQLPCGKAAFVIFCVLNVLRFVCN